MLGVDLGRFAPRGWKPMSLVADRDEKLDEDRQVKVTVPAETLIKLHSVKILTGKNLSEQVADALEGYFDLVEEEEDLV